MNLMKTHTIEAHLNFSTSFKDNPIDTDNVNINDTGDVLTVWAYTTNDSRDEVLNPDLYRIYVRTSTGFTYTVEPSMAAIGDVISTGMGIVKLDAPLNKELVSVIRSFMMVK